MLQTSKIKLKNKNREEFALSKMFTYKVISQPEKSDPQFSYRGTTPNSNKVGVSLSNPPKHGREFKDTLGHFFFRVQTLKDEFLYLSVYECDQYL